MRTPKSDGVILERLVLEAPLSTYALNKITGFSTSTIHAAVKRMTKENLVRRGDKGYLATFIGLTRYLLQRFKDEKFGHDEMRLIIRRYSRLLDHPLFTEQSFLEGWVGKDYYDTFLSAIYTADHMLRSRMRIVWARATGPTKRGETVVLKGFKVPTPREVEEEWLHAFTFWFFKLIAGRAKKTISPPINPRIKSLIKNTFGKEISIRRQSLKDLERTLKALLG